LAFKLDVNGSIMSAHMFEVCESIADGRAKLEVHPLSIGGKEDPVRLVIRAIRAFMHSPRVGVDIIRGLRAHPLALIRNRVWAYNPDSAFQTGQ
jgi:L-arabinose isomerase